MTSVRYGIFLRPDPSTCLAVTQITHAVRQQFGFVSAAAFAPHATVIGNLRTDASDDYLIAKLDRIFEQTRPFPVYNHGIEEKPDAIRYNINLDSAGAEWNRDLHTVADTIRDTVFPLHIPHHDYLAPNVADYTFAGHLSLANFELSLDPSRAKEVAEFIRGLPVTAPPSFAARWYTLFRFPHADWERHWWNDMPWTHLKTWDTHPSSKRSTDK